MPIESDMLIVRKDGHTTHTLPLKPQMSIGRHASVDVQLEDKLMSRVHARVELVQGKYFIVDLGSTNGTLLAGRRLEPNVPTELGDGALAQIACYELAFKIPSAVAQPSLAPTNVNLSRAAAPIPSKPAPHAAVPSELEAPPPPSPLMSHLVDGRKHIPIWAEGQAQLKVADIIEETVDAKTFRLVGIEPLLFSFKPGQFITVIVPIDGKDVRRSYSISSSPSRPHVVELTVKRVKGGLVSNWLNDNLKLGDVLKISGPSGKFSCFNFPSRKILGIAAGSGITPIMSMARWIVDTAADVDFTLLYSARSPNEIIFRKELEYLSSRHSGLRVLITVTSRWSGAESWVGLTGRCTERMLEFAAPDLHERHVFMCGPKPFMDAVKDGLKILDFPTANLHLESFGEGRVAKGVVVPPSEVPVPHAAPASNLAATLPPTVAPAPAPAARATPIAVAPLVEVAAPVGFKIKFLDSKKEAVCAPGSSVLDVAEQHGVEINYACRSGSCLSCKVRCTSGTVEMAENELDPDDRKQGYILACVSEPQSDVQVQA